MGTPKQEVNIPKAKLSLELSFKNPRKRLSDSVPVWIRVLWKRSIAPMVGNPHHQTIIPLTQNHTSWSLGAQPNKSSIKMLYRDEGGSKKRVHIVSMLCSNEMVIAEADPVFADKERDKKVVTEAEPIVANKVKGLATITRIPWFDHGVLNSTTGKNQTVASMREFQTSFYNGFKKNPPDTIFYCHCMAGRSRSLLETMAFIYFYPNKEELFDFGNWPKAITAKIDLNLNQRLQNNPSFSDIAEFVKLQRPKVKSLMKMDGDQAGLVGLMALSKLADHEGLGGLASIESRNINRLYRDARDIGLILKAPLDQSLRDTDDRDCQEENFKVVYDGYKKCKVNLLMAMVVSISTKEIVNPEETFKENFSKLSSSEQARFAILMCGLEKKGCDLKPLEKTALEYAKIAIENAKKPAAGDQVELLKTFGTALGLGCAGVVKKILTGDRIDKHNSGIKLAELLHIALPGDPSIERVIARNMLSYVEQVNFIKRLVELKDARVGYFAKIVHDNYSNRPFPFFSKPLAAWQEKILIDAKKSAEQERQEEQSKTSKSKDGVGYSEVVLKLRNEKKTENPKDIAFKEFKIWINNVKGKLRSEDKQGLVKQYMFDPNNPIRHPGDQERLKVVLAVCARGDLAEELLKKLVEIYPRESSPQLAEVIAELPEVRGYLGWQRVLQKSSCAVSVEKIEEKSEQSTLPGSSPSALL